jgi:hypothetical protein
MNVSQLKQWLNDLPEEIMDYNVVFSQYETREDDEHITIGRSDIGIFDITTDEKEKEMCLFNNSSLEDYIKKEMEENE